MSQLINRFKVYTTVISMTMLSIQAYATSEEEILQMLTQAQPFHAVTEVQFEQLGWELPDGGSNVKALADAAPESAFDPRQLENLPSDKLGYKATWHEFRYQVYGLDWDIPGLHLIPNNPLPGMPTLVIINKGLTQPGATHATEPGILGWSRE